MLLNAASYHSPIDYPGNLYYLICNTISKFSRLNFNVWSIMIGLLICLLIYVAFSQLLQNKAGSKGRWMSVLGSKYGFAGLTIILILFARVPNLIHPELNPDESQWIANAATLIHDPRFWISVDAFTGGPLLVYPLDLIIILGGKLNYVSVRLFGLICCIIPSILLVYFTFVNLYGDKAARIIVLPLIVCFGMMDYYDLIAYNSEHIPTLLIASSIFLYSLILKDGKIKYVFLLGFILGMYPYAKLQAVPMGLIIAFFHLTCIFFEYESMKRFFRESLIFILAGLLPTILVLVYVFSQNAFDNFLQFYIVNNLIYAQKGVKAVEEVLPMRRTLLLTYNYLQSVADTSLYFLWTILALFLTPFLIVIFRKSLSYIDTKLIILSFLIMSTGLYGVVKPGNFFPHYQILLMLPSIYLMGTVVGALLNSLRDHTNPLQQKFLLFSAIAFIFPAVILRTCYSMAEGNSGIARVNKIGFTINRSNLVKAIMHNTHPGEKMAIWGWAHNLYVETGLIQGTMQPSSYYQLEKSERQKEYLQEYITQLATNKPKIFLDAVGTQSIYFKDKSTYNHENFPEIKSFIANNYNFLNEIDNVKIYVLKE